MPSEIQTHCSRACKIAPVEYAAFVAYLGPIPAQGRKPVAASDLVDLLHRYFPFGFQTSRDSWDRFAVRSLLAHAEPFTEENARYTVRRLVETYNERPPSASGPATPVYAEQMISLGVLNDALRYVLLHYALY